MKDLLYESKATFTVPRRHTIKKYNAKARFLAGAGHQPVRAAVMKALVSRVEERVYEMEKKMREESSWAHATIPKRPLPLKNSGRSLRQEVLVREALKRPIPRNMLRVANMERTRLQQDRYFRVGRD